MSQRALITGVTGQDGSYLAEQLLSLGYEVHGLVRRTSTPTTRNIEHLLADGGLVLHEGDLLDQGSLNRVVARVAPGEVYNLAAQSFVGASWHQPVHTAEVTGLGAVRLLEAVRGHAPEARFYQASSSEQYGNVMGYGLLREGSPMRPRSPYGAAKLYAHSMAVNYRESYGLHVSCGILFNHESERRGEQFVTRSISQQVARLALGLADHIRLGNLAAVRDWGYAPDFVDAMRLMLQQDEPGDYVVATGKAHSVRDFLTAALAVVGRWVDDTDVRADELLARPAELDALCGNASLARARLGWAPTTRFHAMVRRMVAHDLRVLDPERHEGHSPNAERLLAEPVPDLRAAR